MKQLSHIISSVFQPLLMPIYSILLLFVYTHFKVVYIQQIGIILLPVILYSFVIPAFLIFILYKLKVISNLSLTIRRERFLPYLITLASYSIMVYHYYRMGMPTWFLTLCAASAVLLVVAIVITLWWKISAHMFGVGGLLGGMMSVCLFVEGNNPYPLFMAFFIIAGMVGTSRLMLRRHTLAQVTAGFLMGYAFSFAAVWIGA